MAVNPAPGGPENLAEVLSRLFTSRGWGRKSERVALEGAWEVVAGPEVARQTRVNALRRGVLEVEVRTNILIQELSQFRKRSLLTSLRQALPGVSLTDIKFRFGVW